MKLHWSIVPCEWDSDFQVGDTMDLSFQVVVIIIIIIIIIIANFIFIIIIIIANFIILIIIIVIIIISADVSNWGKPRPSLC